MFTGYEFEWWTNTSHQYRLLEITAQVIHHCRTTLQKFIEKRPNDFQQVSKKEI